MSLILQAGELEHMADMAESCGLCLDWYAQRSGYEIAITSTEDDGGCYMTGRTIGEIVDSITAPDAAAGEPEVFAAQIAEFADIIASEYHWASQHYTDIDRTIIPYRVQQSVREGLTA